MYKKIFVGLTLGVMLSSAFIISPVSALSVDELQKQIQDLLARVAELQVQLKQATSGTSDIKVTAIPRLCKLMPEKALALGMRNDDVRGLQEFLQGEGFLKAEATGYFGVVTRDALREWQLKNGVVASSDASAGWGTAGPRTREAILKRCGNAGPLSVSPQKGQAPLTVVVTSKVGDAGPTRPSFVDGQDILIDFGDGSERQWVQCELADNSRAECETPASYKHTYEKNGTYTVQLLRTGGRCLGTCSTTVLATLFVRVGDQPIACTKEYKPVCASKPVVCITAPCEPVQQTYGNRCSAVADNATVLYEGECGTSANRPPVVSAFSGPTSLTLNETGTWRISASDPENGSLSYSILWGDEWGKTSAGSASSADYSVVQESAFSHSYARAGSYTVTVIVTDTAGKQVKTSSTVSVSNSAVACTLEYAPVCGRPSGCANSCPPGTFCTAICRLHDPVTYGNRCQLNAANAEFLYSGACATSAQ